MRARPTVLVLDGETTQALAAVRSLGRGGYPVYVASRRRLPLAGWSRFCRGRIHLAEETPTSFAAVRDRASELGVDMTLPLTERSCLLCAGDREAWAQHGIELAIAGRDVLDRAFDKVKTLEYGRAAGVRTPVTHLPRSEADVAALAGHIPFPCVVKSRFSNWWNGDGFTRAPSTTYVGSADALPAAVLAHRQGDHWPAVQEYVAGTGKGVFALYDHGRPLAWFAHERLRDVHPTGSGSSLRRSVPVDARLKGPAERLLTAMEWHGPAMVEFLDDGASEPTLVEVNGRFWGSLQLAVAAGADFPRWWLDTLNGEPPNGGTGYRAGVTVRWLWGDVERLVHIVRGRPRGYPGRYPTRREGFVEVLGRQPPDTVKETWQRDDPWPAVGEWVQGLGTIVERGQALVRGGTARNGRVAPPS